MGPAKSIKLLVDVCRKSTQPAATDPHHQPLRGVEIGDFQILREIGRGGMGFVFEAMQLSLNRRVALKILPMASALKSQCLARFEREAQAAACLEHPHIVRAYTRGEDQGIYYLAMQFIPGQDLARFVGERERELRGSTDSHPTDEDLTANSSAMEAKKTAGTPRCSPTRIESYPVVMLTTFVSSRG